ncbi:hypothetical protein HNY73_013065 [Argiope bruennichi]|uniref:Uncharacterized protein n=1 Tax=Argiope bruennichi TaxID=94029 RepID=A0A8T0F1G8_ARGBR|nr:hypothetical protein HNY73_013065 [Argiope bruennichi]
MGFQCRCPYVQGMDRGGHSARIARRLSLSLSLSNLISPLLSLSLTSLIPSPSFPPCHTPFSLVPFSVMHLLPDSLPRLGSSPGERREKGEGAEWRVPKRQGAYHRSTEKKAKDGQGDQTWMKVDERHGEGAGKRQTGKRKRLGTNRQMGSGRTGVGRGRESGRGGKEVPGARTLTSKRRCVHFCFI